MDNLYYQISNESMKMAMTAAKRTFRFFWRERTWEQRRIVPAHAVSAIKIDLKQISKQWMKENEHVWVGDIQYNGFDISGALLNAPRFTTEWQAGAAIQCKLHHIEDWMYDVAGQVYGGFTIQEMRRAMKAAERAAHDAAWGLDFGDPTAMRVWDGMLYRDLCQLSELELPEHPMSVHMRAKTAEGFASLGTKINERVIGGMPLLHYETLGGNLIQVEQLISHGASTSVTDERGFTVLELADKLGWAKLSALFKSLHAAKSGR